MTHQEAIQAQTHLTPAEEMIGAFSSPEDAAIIDAAMEFVRASRKNYDVIRDFDFPENWRDA